MVVGVHCVVVFLVVVTRIFSDGALSLPLFLFSFFWFFFFLLPLRLSFFHSFFSSLLVASLLESIEHTHSESKKGERNRVGSGGESLLWCR